MLNKSYNAETYIYIVSKTSFPADQVQLPHKEHKNTLRDKLH